MASWQSGFALCDDASNACKASIKQKKILERSRNKKKQVNGKFRFVNENMRNNESTSEKLNITAIQHITNIDENM